jgi:DNA polymerase (family 10)
MTTREGTMPAPNAEIAARLDEVGQLLADQQADPFRVRAYRHAAEVVRNLPESLAELYRERGFNGLEQIPGVGPVIGRAIRDLLNTGRLPMLQRLRGEADPVRLFATVPGIGPGLAERLHSELGVSTLEDLELAAHDGRLAGLRGFGPKRVAGIRGALAQRLGRPPRGRAPERQPPSVAELLEVDREYRDAAAVGTLPTIAPRRFNPGRRSWLPVLHTIRGPRHYTALFSNTAHAHRLGRTRDWVVIYSDGDREEHQATVVTARVGELAGHRIVRGREPECLEYYRRPPARRHASDTTQRADVLAGSSWAP